MSLECVLHIESSYCNCVFNLSIRSCDTGGVLPCPLIASVLRWLVKLVRSHSTLMHKLGQNSESVTKFKGHINVSKLTIHSCTG